MNVIRKIISFLLLHYSTVYAQNFCPSSSCGTKSSSLPIKYPFQIEGQKINNSCSYPEGFNLKCNSQGIPILNLPYSGDFYVNDINSFDREIKLSDPDNCLPKRLFNFTLSSSPFISASYENYTFFNCPPTNGQYQFSPITCLSTNSISVIATSITYYAIELQYEMMCNKTRTLLIPVAKYSQYENGFYGDLILTWNRSIICNECEIHGSSPAAATGNHGSPKILKHIYYMIFIPFVILPALFISILWCKYVANRRRGETWGLTNTTSSMTSQPATVIRGLDKSTIELYTKIVVGENDQILDTSDMICPICLGDFGSGETLRCIMECQHYFHAECIDQWLQMKAICPVCRNALPPVIPNRAGFV